MFRTFLLCTVLGLAALGLTAAVPSVADAQGIYYSYGYSPGYPGYGYSPGYYTFTPGWSYSYYGNGAHDVYPHWHKSNTPYGSYYWYGNGPHDYVPHQHKVTPFGSYGYHYHPWGTTKSYYSTYPQIYSPW